MLNTLKYSALVLAVSVLVSCKKKNKDDDMPADSPVASFSFSLTPNNHAPSTAVFSNQSTNATSYQWNYGDGSPISTATSANHTYSTAGTYTITLTATGDGGSNSVSTSVTILNTITTAKVTKIKLQTYPMRDSAGNAWDAADGPDIYFRLYKSTPPVLLHDYSNHVQNNATGSPVTLVLDTAYQVSSFSDTMYVAAFDKEVVGQDSLIGKGYGSSHHTLVGFKMSDYTLSYPDSIHLNSSFSSDSLDYWIYIQWQ